MEVVGGRGAERTFRPHPERRCHRATRPNVVGGSTADVGAAERERRRAQRERRGGGRGRHVTAADAKVRRVQGMEVNVIMVVIEDKIPSTILH